MPRFFFTTDDGKQVDEDEEGIDLPNQKVASDEAQSALADIAREGLPNGSRADFSVTVDDESKKEVYRASLRFREETKTSGRAEGGLGAPANQSPSRKNKGRLSVRNPFRVGRR